jgi:hypothetical protein
MEDAGAKEEGKGERVEGGGRGSRRGLPVSAPPCWHRVRLWCHGAEQKSGRVTVSGGGVNEEKDGEVG